MKFLEKHNGKLSWFIKYHLHWIPMKIKIFVIMSRMKRNYRIVVDSYRFIVQKKVRGQWSDLSIGFSTLKEARKFAADIIHENAFYLAQRKIYRV